MAKPIIDDELWTLIEPLLPPPKPRREKNPGRLPVSNRAALTGILFVLKTGLRWRDLPAEMGCGSGVTCWRRLRDWQPACGIACTSYCSQSCAQRIRSTSREPPSIHHRFAPLGPAKNCQI